MSALTSGPFGDGRAEGDMRNGTFLGPESLFRNAPEAVASGIVIDGSWYTLGGQPARATGGTWGDMSWLRSPFYAYPGLLG